MRDLFELLRLVFVGKSITRKPYPKKVTMPPKEKPLKVEVTVKNKERLEELKRIVQDLEERVELQAELLERLTRAVGKLTRDTAHLLPEK